VSTSLSGRICHIAICDVSDAVLSIQRLNRQNHVPNKGGGFRISKRTKRNNTWCGKKEGKPGPPAGTEEKKLYLFKLLLRLADVILTQYSRVGTATKRKHFE